MKNQQKPKSKHKHLKPLLAGLGFAVIVFGISLTSSGALFQGAFKAKKGPGSFQDLDDSKVRPGLIEHRPAEEEEVVEEEAALPDFVVDHISLTGANELKFAVSNQGEADVTDSVHIFVYIDEEDVSWTYSSITLPDPDFLLAGGETTIIPQILDQGEHEIEVCVDATDAVVESNETNNCMEATVEVSGYTTFITDTSDAECPGDALSAGLSVAVYCFAMQANNSGFYLDGLSLEVEADLLDGSALGESEGWEVYDLDDLSTILGYGTYSGGQVEIEFSSPEEFNSGDEMSFIVKAPVTLDAARATAASLGVSINGAVLDGESYSDHFFDSLPTETLTLSEA